MSNSQTQPAGPPRLHDAKIEAVNFDVASRELRFIIKIVGDEDTSVLTFFKVTQFIAGAERPWGPSTSINEVLAMARTDFRVELQSGDVWSIQAASWSYTPSRRREA